jgi:DNA polymerase-3 subunit alpha
VELKRIGKRPLEMLARAGAFDALDPNRRRVLESLDALMAYSAAVIEQKTSAQVSLFGEAGDDLPEPRLANVPDWLPAERLAEEFAAVGFYLSGHPLDDDMAALRRRDVLTLEEVQERVQRGPAVVKMAGVVAGRQERKSARGNRFAFVQLSDPTGAYEVTLFSEALEAARELLEPGAKVVVRVEATLEADQLKLLGRGVMRAEGEVAQAGATGLRIFVEAPEAIQAVAGLIDAPVAQVAGHRPGPLKLCLIGEGLPGEVEVDIGRRIAASAEIRRALKSLPGVVDVQEA